MWQYFLDVVDVLFKTATTIIAAFGAWMAYQTLLRTPEQEAESDASEATEDEVAGTRERKVFHTSKQTTWLKTTAHGLECHIDERRPGKQGGLQWTISKEAAAEILENGDYSVNAGYKLNTGVFSIGARRHWLYSKKLYPEPALLRFEIMKLLQTVNA